MIQATPQRPKISIAIPIHNTPNLGFFLSRMMNSIFIQSFRDFEIVITHDGEMAHNHNSAILKSKGELIKLMQMDDYFSHSNSLKDIVDNFSENDNWMITACDHSLVSEIGLNPHFPSWNDQIYNGNNTLGGFSTLTIRNEGKLLLDESLIWVVDCDLYKRYYDTYGPPKLLNSVNVTVDIREDRLTNLLSDELKKREVNNLIKKYAK